MRRVAGLALLAGGVLLGPYGLFALLYGGDSGGRDTYVTFAGHELDAGVAGAIAVLLALLLLAAVPLLKRDRPLTRL